MKIQTVRNRHVVVAYRTMRFTESWRLPAYLEDEPTFDVSYRAQVLLKAIVKLGISDRLKVTGVNPARGRGVAAFAHAGVVAQPSLVQIRVSQGIFR